MKTKFIFKNASLIVTPLSPFWRNSKWPYEKWKAYRKFCVRSAFGKSYRKEPLLLDRYTFTFCAQAILPLSLNSFEHRVNFLVIFANRNFSKIPNAQFIIRASVPRSIKNVSARHLTIKLFVFCLLWVGFYASAAANKICANDLNEKTLD